MTHGSRQLDLRLEIFDAESELANDLANVHMIHARYFGPAKPFYWVAPADKHCAPTGWYQWTENGLIYLGETVLSG